MKNISNYFLYIILTLSITFNFLLYFNIGSVDKEKYTNFNDVPENDTVSILYPDEKEKIIFKGLSEPQIDKFCDEMFDEILLLKNKDRYKHNNIKELIEYTSTINPYINTIKENMSSTDWEYLVNNVDVTFSENGKQYSSHGITVLKP